jgi:hypothetical protein
MNTLRFVNRTRSCGSGWMRPGRVTNGMHSPAAPVTLETIARILLTASTEVQQTLVDVVAPARGWRATQTARAITGPCWTSVTEP